MSQPSGSRSGYRGLWASVVLKAIEDIQGQPVQSAAFAEAVAFFTSSGAWAESRTMIGDFLEFHRDDLEAIGKRCISARRSEEEFTPETLRRSPDELCEASLDLAGLDAREQGVMPCSFHRPTPRPTPAASQPNRAAQKLIPISISKMTTILDCSLVFPSGVF
jgi:hypothetical protein